MQINCINRESYLDYNDMLRSNYISDANVIQVATYKTKQTKFQLTLFYFYNEFVLLKTDDGYFWSAELDGNNKMLIQKSRIQDDVVNKNKNGTRNSNPTPLKETVICNKPLKDILQRFYNSEKCSPSKDSKLFAEKLYNYCQG